MLVRFHVPKSVLTRATEETRLMWDTEEPVVSDTNASFAALYDAIAKPLAGDHDSASFLS